MLIKTESTGNVIVRKAPQGPEPEWIRKAWVNCELPTSSNPASSESGFDLTVYVPQKEALNILAGHDAGAANWWMRRDYPKSGQFFAFNLDEVEIRLMVVV